MARALVGSLREEYLVALLEYLNTLSHHRFTGIYRFEPGWVVSVALYDRENPNLRTGASAKMKESYCSLTGVSGTGFVITDAWERSVIVDFEPRCANDLE